MVKHLYVYQDIKSLNCSDPVVATNPDDMKRSFAWASASGGVPSHIVADTRVLELGDISYDDNNTPLLMALPVPAHVFFGSDPDVTRLIHDFKQLIADSGFRKDPCDSCVHYDQCHPDDDDVEVGDEDA